MSTEDQKAREAFEAWMKLEGSGDGLVRAEENFPDVGLIVGDYLSVWTQSYWEVWQAARVTPSLDVDALMALAEKMATARRNVGVHAARGEFDESNVATAEFVAAREALRLALMSNAAPEVDRSGRHVDAARRNALEQAAKVVEETRELTEATRAQKAVTEALDRDDGAEVLRCLRHSSTVHLFNGALERAAAAIRALADPLQGKETPR